MKKAACFVLLALCASTGAQAHTPPGQRLAACAEDLADTIVNNPFFGLMVMAVGVFVGLRWKRRIIAKEQQAKEQH